MWETLDQELQELPAFPTLIAGDTHHSNNHLCCRTLQTNVLNTQAQAQPSCLKSLRREHNLQPPRAGPNYIPLVCNLVQVWYQPKPQAQIDVIIIIVVIAIIRIGRRAVCWFILTWGEGKYSRRGSLDLEGRQSLFRFNNIISLVSIQFWALCSPQDIANVNPQIFLPLV